jgi:sugar/nucleoside kinase (ribokinase family)
VTSLSKGPTFRSPLNEGMDQGSHASRIPKRLGVIGTMIWDRIVDRGGRSETVEEWGGISYALEALSASLPPQWSIVPIMKVGEDLSEKALRYLRTIPRLRLGVETQTSPAPNPRVELRYQDSIRRFERLHGSIPEWRWEDLEPLVASVDAVYVNFITGFELNLQTAQALREKFQGPIYADLHSLFLGISSHGTRFPSELSDWGSWFSAFDAVQMNEQEFQLLGRGKDDPWNVASKALGPELKLILVTLGREGSAYMAAPDLSPDPWAWPAARQSLGSRGAAMSGKVPLASGTLSGDPTGCGDVWGATFFGRLLAGDPLIQSLQTANAFASLNVSHRGATGLHRFLTGKLGL